MMFAAPVTRSCINFGWWTKKSIDLIIFLATCLLGYPYDPETIQSRAGRGAFGIAGLRDRKATCGSTLMIGVFELLVWQVFNSAFVIEADQVVGRYAKAHSNEPGVSADATSPSSCDRGCGMA